MASYVGNATDLLNTVPRVHTIRTGASDLQVIGIPEWKGSHSWLLRQGPDSI